MALVVQPLAKFNLSQSSILLLEPSAAELDLYCQMLFGYGGKNVHRCQTRDEARQALAGQQMDLVIVDAKLGPADEDGYAFVRELRRSGGDAGFLPVIMLTGHTPGSQVTFARDSGVHFVIRKPVSASVLLERILWIAQEGRSIIECDSYVGPDRRFQRLGPPQGVGRRSGDVSTELGDAQTPNLGQDEVDNLMQPKKAQL
ncbi:MAG: response regulator [Phenylobacterium sp.]|nr:response regulator [Phenylobacterium sp.]